jgi:DNA invertase Pin-like site-specific DNA recombinase
MKIGYMRVSRGDRQDVALQEAALKKDGCKKIFSDAASGARWDRPGMKALLEHLRPGVEVIVWKLDRVSRSLGDLVFFIDALRQKEAGLRSLTEPFDTTGPMGRMVAQMLGVIAEFERQLIIERTKAGLEAARAQGRIGGRPPALNADQKAKIIADIRAETMTQVEAARLFRVSVSTISRLMASAKEPEAAE